MFSLGYSEGIAITWLALGLLALMRRRWVVAGILGAVATATIPVALAFAVSCLWAAVVAIRRNREWRALVAPILVPAGFAAYQLWLWAHTGNPSAWRLTERGGWKSYVSAAYPFEVVWKLTTRPLRVEESPAEGPPSLKRTAETRPPPQLKPTPPRRPYSAVLPKRLSCRPQPPRQFPCMLRLSRSANIAPGRVGLAAKRNALTPQPLEAVGQFADFWS